MQISKDQGFTLLETIMSLIIILLILSLSFPLLQSLKSPDYYNELAARQLFTFIQEAVNTSRTTIIRPDSIQMMDDERRTVVIEQYNNLVRRTVDGKGHEILLQDIQTLQIDDNQSTFEVWIEMEDGENYKKSIHRTDSQP